MEIKIRNLTLGLVGAAAVLAGLALLKQKRDEPQMDNLAVPAGETSPRQLTLERIRELGI
jgi:hypothetical protein